MLEIIRQFEDTRQGNDCLIKDCVVWMKCHGKHIVMTIRRYVGWCDNGMNSYRQKEFDESNDACDWYWYMVDNHNKY